MTTHQNVARTDPHYSTFRDVASVLSLDTLTTLLIAGQPAVARQAVVDELTAQHSTTYADLRRSLSGVDTAALPGFVGKTLRDVSELAVLDELAARNSSE